MSEEQTRADVKAAVLEAFRTWCAKDVEGWKRVTHPAIYGYYYTGDQLGGSAPGETIDDAFRSLCESGLTSSMSPLHIAIRLVGNDAAIATFYIQGRETWPGVHTIEGTWRGSFFQPLVSASADSGLSAGGPERKANG